MVGTLLAALLGAGVGALVFGSLEGALGCGALGLVLAALAQRITTARPRSAARHIPPTRLPRAAPIADQAEALASAIAPLFVEVARVDAPMVQLEVRIAREFFLHQLRFDEPRLELVRQTLKSTLAAPPRELEALAAEARTLLKPAERVSLVRSLYETGLVDGPLTRSEHEALKRIVGTLNVSDEQLREITTALFGAADDSYRELGLQANATDDEVKSAYRQLAAAHHPDRSHDGGERFRAVKEAYETIRRLRGL